MSIDCGLVWVVGCDSKPIVLVINETIYLVLKIWFELQIIINRMND